jgi:SEC-C motif-containing protein
MTQACPCGAGQVLDDCCGRFHRGTAAAPTAEALMRSRYSAFAVGDWAYLLRTWHPTTRPNGLDLDPGIRWTRLEILDHVGGDVFDSEGRVEFAAHYESNGVTGVQRELSSFRRVDGVWYYRGIA